MRPDDETRVAETRARNTSESSGDDVDATKGERRGGRERTLG
jgi:hypothetical protein